MVNRPLLPSFYNSPERWYLQMVARAGRVALAVAASGAVAVGLTTPVSSDEPTTGDLDGASADIDSKVRRAEVPSGEPKFVAIEPGGAGPGEAAILAYRRSMGFSTSDEAVRAAQRASEVEPDLMALTGIPHTREEAAEAHRRRVIDDHVMLAQSALQEAWPDRFAGIEVDHSNGAVVTIRMVDPQASDNLRGLFPDDTNLEVLPVERSLGDLREESAELSERLDGLGWVAEGVRVDGVAINLELNAVELVVAPAFESRVDDVLNRVGTETTRVVLRESRQFQPTGHTDAAAAGGQLLGYWEGGAIFRPALACSTAFPVIRNGSEGVTTAEHCMASPLGGWAYTTYSPDFQTVGSHIVSVDSPSAGVEAAMVGYRDMLPKIWFPETGNWNNYKFLRWAWVDGIPEGVAFHMTAPRTNTRYYSWAGVDEFDVTVLGYQHMQIGWACSQGGDSGSPVYTMHADGTIVAGGILSFGDSSPSCNTSTEQVVWGRASQAVGALGAGFLTA